MQSYDAEFLKIYPDLQPTPLQLEEDLEQLKVLENGYKLKVVGGWGRLHGVIHPIHYIMHFVPKPRSFASIYSSNNIDLAVSSYHSNDLNQRVCFFFFFGVIFSALLPNTSFLSKYLQSSSWARNFRRIDTR